MHSNPTSRKGSARPPLSSGERSLYSKPEPMSLNKAVQVGRSKYSAFLLFLSVRPGRELNLHTQLAAERSNEAVNGLAAFGTLLPNHTLCERVSAESFQPRPASAR